jgi:hypothetical protein
MKCSACAQRKIDARLELYPAGSWPCASGGGEVYDGSKETAPSCQSETSLWPDCRRVPVGLESTSSLEGRFALVVAAAICLRALQGCEGAVGGGSRGVQRIRRTAQRLCLGAALHPSGGADCLCRWLDYSQRELLMQCLAWHTARIITNPASNSTRAARGRWRRGPSFTTAA